MQTVANNGSLNSTNVFYVEFPDDVWAGDIIVSTFNIPRIYDFYVSYPFSQVNNLVRHPVLWYSSVSFFIIFVVCCGTWPIINRILVLIIVFGNHNNNANDVVNPAGFPLQLLLGSHAN